MRLIQFAVPGRGNRVGLMEGGRVLDITAHREGINGAADLLATGGTAAGVERLVRRLRGAGRRASCALASLDRPPGSRVAHLRVPIDSPEVWGGG